MMGLKLKHLAGYLPYGLKALYGNPPHVEYRQVSIIGAIHRDFESHPTRVFADNMDSEHIWMFKPLLYPLSSLTKPIKHNGEEFVPIEKLNKDGEVIFGKNHCFYPADGLREIHLSEFTGILEHLYEWHFDIYGLIDAGLAIDVTTLEKNPYE